MSEKEKMMNRQPVIIVLADGFEETEAVGTADVLKRIGFSVQLAGLNALLVTSSAGTRIQADLLFQEVKWENAAALVLPGGLPGATNLRDHQSVIDALRRMHQAGKVIAAICAAPIVLERAGLTEGKCLTGYPGTNQNLSKLVYTGNRTECDGNIVTGKGPGAAFEFGARIAAALKADPSKINAVLDGMFVLR